MKIQRKKTIQRFTTRFVNWAAIRVNKIHKPVVIVVTGSIGKTSTRKAISDVLDSKYRIYHSTSSINSKRGLRLHFFGIHSMYGIKRFRDWLGYMARICWMMFSYPYDAVVLEVAENYIDSSLAILRKIDPKICVVTGVADAHMEHLGSKRRLMKNIRKIAECCDEVIYSADFDELQVLFGSSRAKSYGIEGGEYRPSNITRMRDGLLSFDIVVDGARRRVKTQMIARHLLLPYAAAAIIGKELGLDASSIVSALEDLEPVHGRMNLLKANCGASIIDDSYNANLVSAKAALDQLKEFSGYKVAVIGTMNELGAKADEHHAELAMYASTVADKLIFVGERAEYMKSKATKNLARSGDLYAFHDTKAAGKFLNENIGNTWTVLFKGSGANVYLEEAIKRLIPAAEVSSLVRQSPNYIRRKEEYFALLDIDN